MSRNALCINNKIITLTPEDMRRIKINALNLLLVERRMNDGWSKEEATTLRRDYVTKWGSIYWKREFPDVTFYIPLREKQRIRIENYQIERNYGLGKTFEEIIGNDFEYFLEKNEDFISSEEIEQKKRNEEREKRKRPWLYDGTPQVHPRSKYCQYLMDTSIFVKAVR